MFIRKRMISVVISCVLVAQILTSTMFNLTNVEAASLDSTSAESVEESKESTRIGDVDGNGEVNSLDFARMRMVLLGMIASFPVSNGTWAADVSGDGIFNSIDFAFMRQYILGFITKFPAEANNATPTTSVSVTPTPIDIEPPSKPTGLNYSSVTGTTVSIYWEPSIDSDIKDYAVYKNSEFVVLTDGETEYTFTNLIPNETYEFKVCAIDASDNKSEFSDVCVITTKVSTIDEIKIALIHNFNKKGMNYSLTYHGDVTDLQAKVNQAISDAVNESNEPFMLSDLTWSADGYSGNLQITFNFVYDDENEYIAVARSTDELKKALLLGFYSRTQNINIIYKGAITESDINSAKEAALSYDTYLKACLKSYEGSVVTNENFGINAIRLNCSYKTTKEQEAYIDRTVEFIVSKLTNIDMSEDEKEKLIHDYIVTNIDYCEEEKYGDAYSALYYGKTKCDGYAMLTYKMLKAAGVENVIVTNEDHAWNVVKINENWYHLDTTWDDAKKKDYGFYRYYNLADDEILETRNYNNVYGIECTSNYINDLTERNNYSDGKYGEILKEIEQDDDYYYVNSFNSNASLNLLYNEIALKEGESISLLDAKIPTELYENSYQWSTSDPDVASVTNGIITAKEAGTIMISAQPMYDMLSTTSLFCRVRVIPVNSEDGKTPQVLSQESISGITDSSVELQLTINSEDDIRSTTTVTNAKDLLEGKIWYIAEPVNINTTSEFDWAEIGFKLSEEQLASYDINDLVIYWYDEENGTIVPQATIVDEESGVVSATVTHFSTYFVASRQVSNLTTTIAFVIDSTYSNQLSLDTFRESIGNTIVELRKKSHVRAIFIDAKTNKTIRERYYPAEGVYTGNSVTPLADVEGAFVNIKPGGMTPSNEEILATVNSGMTSGEGRVNNFHVSGCIDNKYILFYSRWDVRFVDSDDIVSKLGDTIGLAIGNTVGYYAGGPISYKQTDVTPLIEFLLEGNYTQVSLSNTNRTPWVLKQNGSNIENDVIVLQKMLVSLGFLTIEPFGTYTGNTESAVKKFQKNNGLDPDGKVGKNTWNKLMLPWDEKNAQPDRNSWSYKYILLNNNFYVESPQVTLTEPNVEGQLEVGRSIKITAKGTNCHHLAVFINGEWKKTIYGDSNTKTIYLEYDYVIPVTGKYTIQVKGRNIPGNSGVLVSSETIEIEGIEPPRKLAEEIWLYLEMIKEYQAIVDAPNGTFLGTECSTIEEVETYKLNLRNIVQYFQFELLENPLVRSNSAVSKYLAQNIIYGNGIDLVNDTLIRQHLRENNSVIDEVFGEYVHKLWLECGSMLLNIAPIIGSAKAIAEGIVGHDLLTGRNFVWWERALNIGMGSIGLVGEVGMLSATMKNSRLASKLSDIATIAGNSAVKAMATGITKIKIAIKTNIDDLSRVIKKVFNRVGNTLEVECAGFGRMKFDDVALLDEIDADIICQQRYKNYLEATWSETAGVLDDAAETLMNGQQYTKNGRMKVLKPDISYTSKGYNYSTDSLGRIKEAEGNLTLNEASRNPYAQRQAGRIDRLSTDDGGHLIGTQFDGSGELDNLVPMNSQINRSGGKWYQMETRWKEALEAGKPVSVKIEPVYSGVSQRSISFEINYKIGNADWEEVIILNQSGG